MKIRDIGIALIALGIFGLFFYIPLLVLLLIPGVIFVAVNRFVLTKKCPYCYERVDKKQQVCPYCDKDLSR